MIKDEAWRAEKLALISCYNEKNKNIKPGGTVCCGSSLMERFPIEQWSKGKVINRGVGGYTIEEYADIIDICCLDLKPSRIFINIGTNDLNDGGSNINKLIVNYGELLRTIRKAVPDVDIYVMAYYPVNDDTDDEFMKEELKYRTNELINEVNLKLKDMAKKLRVNFIDINSCITDPDGKLIKEYSVDGVHINEKGYKKIYEKLQKFFDEQP